MKDRRKSRNATEVDYNGKTYRCAQQIPQAAQLINDLERKVTLGESKRTARQNARAQAKEASPTISKADLNKIQSAGIHSEATIKTYVQQCRDFGRWLEERGLKYCCRADAKELAKEYIETQCWNSAWSQRTARSALAKAMGCPGTELGDVAPRLSQDIKRGRTETLRAASVERANPVLAEIGRSLGLRHSREFDQVTGSSFRETEAGLVCHVRGKGGKWRDALVIGPGEKYIREAIVADESHGKAPLWHIPSHANVHSWRADYAQRAYGYAVDHGYCSGEYYRPRDGSGIKWDKGALDWVNSQVGHGGNRYGTIVHNYLSYGKI